ncbi:hypothetical protein ACEPAI_1315 [Sanghuangporus weigelae]
MNKCPLEVVEFIVELACPDDAGKTARSIGLVSEHLRSIAEPIELRYIAVSGLKRLNGVIARLEKAREREVRPGTRTIEVHHLFLTQLEGPFRDMPRVCKSVGPRKVAKLEYCGEIADEFWTLATNLIQDSRTTLRSLSLLISNVYAYRGLSFYEGTKSSEIFSSGLPFPKLGSLTVEQFPTLSHSNERIQFQAPVAPLLRRLHIHSRDSRRRRNLSSEVFVHPLLVDVHHKYPELAFLFISSQQISYPGILHSLFGKGRRTLPGQLRSVVLQPLRPERRIFAADVQRRETAEAFVGSVRHCNIEGVKVRLFDESQSQYELLMAEWKEECKRICN